jgi:hypothetical protein
VAVGATNESSRRAETNQRTALRSLTTSEKEAIEAALGKARVEYLDRSVLQHGWASLPTLESKIKALKIDKRSLKLA